MQSRDEIAEQVVALAGSVSSEKADTIRRLVEDARRAGLAKCQRCDRLAVWDGFCRRHEGCQKSTTGSDGAPLEQPAEGLSRSAARATSGPVVSLEERVHRLEESMSKMRERVFEIVREEIELVRGGEDPHAAPSPASSVPANATGKVSMQIHETVEDGKLISVDVCPMLPDQMASHGFASFYGPNARAEAERYLASRATAPATGEVPAWIPSVEEMLELIDDGREGDLISLIASRAPAAPVVDVRRLLDDYVDGTCATAEEDMTRALAAQGVKCKEAQP